MDLAERFKIVPVCSQMDISGALTDCESINMKGFHKCTFLFEIGTLAGAALYLQVFSGATANAVTSALTFKYAYGSAAVLVANSDVLGAEASTDTLIIAHVGYDDTMLIVEVDATDMDVANQEEWLTAQFADTATGVSGTVTGFAILEPRYTKNLSASATI
jgi:hypothetical protein